MVYRLYSDDDGATWTAAQDHSLVWFEQYGTKSPPSPYQTYASGFTPRFHKTQQIAYTNSGDLRAIEINTSGNFPVIDAAFLLRPQPLILVTSASGGEVCGSGPTVKVIIKNMSGNKDIFIGGNQTTYYPYSGYGYCLSDQEAITVKAQNLNLIYACANNSGDRLTVLGDAPTA